MNDRQSALLDAAADLYESAPARRFARGKLRLDPVFTALLARGCLPDRGTLLDLGCGQGLLPALLVTARQRFACGDWPPDWPPPPLHLELRGVEVDARRAAAAQRALGEHTRVELSDIRRAAFPSCTALALLDVLMYLGEEEQRAVLEKAAAALEPGGVLLMREADAGAGFSFRITRCGERMLEIFRGHLRDRLHYRTAAQWSGLLRTVGFSVETVPMNAGTPFANVLFVCRKSRVTRQLAL